MGWGCRWRLRVFDRIVEAPGFDAVAHEAPLAGSIACAARPESAFIDFFRAFVELVNRDGVCSRLVNSAYARTVVTRVALRECLHVCVVVMVITM